MITHSPPLNRICPTCGNGRGFLPTPFVFVIFPCSLFNQPATVYLPKVPVKDRIHYFHHSAKKTQTPSWPTHPYGRGRFLPDCVHYLVCERILKWLLNISPKAWTIKSASAFRCTLMMGRLSRKILNFRPSTDKSI